MWQWTVSKFSSIQIFQKTGKGKKKPQHVFFLLNKLLGAKLYRVINNTMVNVGTGEPINKLVYSELAVAKLILFWEHKNIFEFILNSSYGGEWRSQKERWKVKPVSLILSRAPWAVCECDWAVIPPNVTYSYPPQGQCCGKDVLLFILQVHWRRWHKGRPWTSRENGDFSCNSGSFYLNIVCFSETGLGKNKGS